MATLSKSAAQKQADRESSMYHQGSGWVVSTWSDTLQLNVLSSELPYHDAQRKLYHWRVRRAFALQGIPEGEE